MSRKTQDVDMRMTPADAVMRWNLSRNIVIIYMIFFSAVLAGFTLYVGAVQNEETYDANCLAPGTLTSTIWSWDFIIQGLYGVFLIPYIVVAFLMLLWWYTRVPYYIMVVYTLLLTGYFLGTGVYLSRQAILANTAESPGNPFNDLRICGVYGTLLAWSSVCFNQAPYDPPVLDGLYINTAKSFQLGFHWVFFVLLIMALVYIPTYYLRSQNAYFEVLMQPVLPSSVDDADNTRNSTRRTRDTDTMTSSGPAEEPLLTGANMSSEVSILQSRHAQTQSRRISLLRK